MRPAPPVRRALVGAVLVVAAVLMAGLPALSVGVPGGSMAGMAGMSEVAGVSAETNGALPDDSAEGTTLLVGCDAMCGDLLSACLAVLTFLAALALPGARRLPAAPVVDRAVRERRCVEKGSPPWSVLSLSQLSVRRV